MIEGATSTRHHDTTTAVTDATTASRPAVNGALTMLHLGAAVRCTDDVYGELADIVLFPSAGRVTHLVVAPRHHHDQARLAPFALVTPNRSPEPEIVLGCTVVEAHALPEVQEYAYLRLDESPPLQSDDDMVGIEDVLSVSTQMYDTLQLEPWGYGRYGPRVFVTYDRIPRGEVEVRHLSEVMGADGGRVGRLDGLIVDDQGIITQVVVEQRHLWRHRRVTMPAGMVARFGMDSLRLAPPRAA